MKLSLNKAEHQTWFAHGWLSEEHEFELADFALSGPIGPLSPPAVGHARCDDPLLAQYAHC